MLVLVCDKLDLVPKFLISQGPGGVDLQVMGDETVFVEFELLCVNLSSYTMRVGLWCLHRWLFIWTAGWTALVAVLSLFSDFDFVLSGFGSIAVVPVSCVWEAFVVVEPPVVR
jgi:hypothetical protein